MRVLRLDATHWKSIDDYYDAMLTALEAPHWHGRSVNALLDSMCFGGINGIDPPYKVWIVGTSGLPPEVMREIGYMVMDVGSQQGKEPEIVFQIDP